MSVRKKAANMSNVNNVDNLEKHRCRSSDWVFCKSLSIWYNFSSCIQQIILGVAYSVLASGLWPLVAIIIPEYQLGTAYGVWVWDFPVFSTLSILRNFRCQAVQNLGLAIVSIITGSIVDKWGFRVLSLFFLGNLFSKYRRPSCNSSYSAGIFSVAFMFTSILLIIDQRERGVLNLTPRGRKRHQEVLL